MNNNNNVNNINNNNENNINDENKEMFQQNKKENKIILKFKMKNSMLKNKKKESPNKINKSIKNLQTYNNDIKKCLKMKEFNTMKFKKKGGSNQNLITISKIKRHFSPRNIYSSIL